MASRGSKGERASRWRHYETGGGLNSLDNFDTEIRSPRISLVARSHSVALLVMASKGAKPALTKAFTFKLTVPAGKAAPAPPVGPALGQRGVKTIDFCKQFNDRTKHLTPGIPTPCRITVNPDRSFSFVTKSPPTGWLLLRAAGLEKGASKPGEEIAGNVSVKHIYEIAKIKQTDFLGGKMPLEAVARAVVGQCRTMGLKVVL